MLEASYFIEHTPAMIKKMAEGFNSELITNSYTVIDQHLDARQTAYQVNESVSLVASEFTCLEPLRVRRLGTHDPDLLSLDFHLTEAVELKLENSDGPNALMFGSYFATADVASFTDFIAPIQNRQLSFVISRQWLSTLLQNDFPSSRDFLAEHRQFFLYREANFELFREVQSLYETVISENSVIPGFILGQSLKVFALFFNQLSSLDSYPRAFNPQDLELLSKAKSFIDQRVEENINMKDILEVASMSDSKFRHLFKSMYGKSPYEYARQMKLWHAKKLIEQGQAISQAIYSIGYVNRSYFTRTFKQQFGLTPTDYLKHLNKGNNS
ncbi:MAG: AraC family transcriptional regulator [Bacteroidota bacterium]